MIGSLTSVLDTHVWSDLQRRYLHSSPWLLPMRELDERVFFPYRYTTLTERLAQHLQGVANVLEVGASCGRLARCLMDACQVSIIGIDVCLQPRSYIEVRHYDGYTFPFDDGTFDCVLMVDMLHHASDIEQIMREACRVSRRYVLIKDHYQDTPVDEFLLRVADYLGNAPYGIALPYRYLLLGEWAGLFHHHNLEMVSYDLFRLHPLDPCKHIAAKLQKTIPYLYN